MVAFDATHMRVIVPADIAVVIASSVISNKKRSRGSDAEFLVLSTTRTGYFLQTVVVGVVFSLPLEGVLIIIIGQADPRKVQVSTIHSKMLRVDGFLKFGVGALDLVTLHADGLRVEIRDGCRGCAFSTPITFWHIQAPFISYNAI